MTVGRTTCDSISFGRGCTLPAGHSGNVHIHEEDGDARYSAWMELSEGCDDWRDEWSGVAESEAERHNPMGDE